MNYNMKNYSIYLILLLSLYSKLCFSNNQIVVSDTLIDVIPATQTSSKYALIEHLDKGVYELNVDVFITPKNTQDKLYFQLSNPWHSIPFDLSETSTGSWVTLSKEVTLNEDIVQSSIGFFVPFSRNENIEADFYLGDISLNKKGIVNAIGNTYNQVVIYPNPTQSDVTIKGENIKSIYVFDTMGVLENHIENPRQKVSLRNYKKGIYIFKLLMEDDNYLIRKVVLN